MLRRARLHARLPVRLRLRCSSNDAVRSYAQDEVRRARRRQREEEDEICLFNAAWRAAHGTVDAFDASVEGASCEKRRRAIDTHIARQVALLFGSMLNPLGITPGVPPAGMAYAIEVGPSIIPDANEMDPAAIAEATAAMAKREGAGAKAGVAVGKEDDVDEHLAMAVPGGAGRGLIIRGHASAGDVVAFYPGTVYRSEDVRWFGGYSAMLRRASKSDIYDGDSVGGEDEGMFCADYMLGRVGGFVVDGLGSGFQLTETELAARDADDVAAYLSFLEARDSAAPPTPLSMSATSFEDHARTLSASTAGYGNAWANGHFANHPPRGRSANVIGWPYDFPVANLPERLVPLLPNSYAVRAPFRNTSGLERGGGNNLVICPHAIVLVAATDLRDGDEAFLDYGFEQVSSDGGGGGTGASTSSESSLPSWFFPARLRGDVLITDNAADEEIEKSISPRDAAYNALMEWKAEFSAKNGGQAPGFSDLMGDPTAKALFEEFQRHNPLEWDEDDGPEVKK